MALLQTIENEFDAAGDAELFEQANQVLVPTVSGLQESAPKSLGALYRESYRLILFSSVPTFAFLAAAAPIVSRIWLGRYETSFVTFVELLAAAWLINTLANPAYVFDLGTGTLRWVSIACATTGILNASLGFLLGKRFGGTTVVIISAASLAFGYLILLGSYHFENHEPFVTLFPKESLWVILSSAAGVLVFLPLFQSASRWNAPITPGFLAAPVGLLATLGVPVWVHPLRKRLTRWAVSRLPA